MGFQQVARFFDPVSVLGLDSLPSTTGSKNHMAGRLAIGRTPENTGYVLGQVLCFHFSCCAPRRDGNTLESRVGRWKETFSKNTGKPARRPAADREVRPTTKETDDKNRSSVPRRAGAATFIPTPVRPAHISNRLATRPT